jgi:hypothetical protein
MLPVKYLDMGFDIAKFGSHSSVLRFNQKPIFVFCSGSGIEADFLIKICNCYLNINQRVHPSISLKIKS